MMLLNSQEWVRVENNTQHKSSNTDRNIGKGWVELDCRAHSSELGWWTTPHKIEDDISN